MLKKHGLYALFGAVCIAMLGLAAYGALSHQEAGLLTACAAADGKLDYDGDCFPVAWEDAPPLRVHVSGAEPWQVDSLNAAANSFDRELRADAFQVVTDPLQAQVLARFDIPEEVGRGTPEGRVQHWNRPNAPAGAGHVGKCEVYLSNLATGPMAAVTLRHELGHVLGLAHDDYTNSLMTGQPLDPEHHYPLSEDDRDLLRERFGAQRKATLQ